MDDKIFDKHSSQEWIQLIESGLSKRDEDIYPYVNSWVKKNDDISTILDLGCGQGICFEKLELNEVDYRGVDPSGYLIDRARENHPDFIDKFILGSAYSIPFADSSFDAAFSIAVWHLLEDLQKACAELTRILKNGGHFLIITANPNSFDEWGSIYDNIKITGDQIIGEKLTNNKKSQDTLYIRDISKLKKEFARVELNVEKVTPMRIWSIIEGQKIIK